MERASRQNFVARCAAEPEKRPSRCPSPIGWERVPAGRVRENPDAFERPQSVRFMSRIDFVFIVLLVGLVGVFSHLFDSPSVSALAKVSVNLARKIAYFGLDPRLISQVVA